MNMGRKTGIALAGTLAAALLAAGGPARAAKVYPSAGTTSAAFLKLGVGARPVAMGGIHLPAQADPFALYWNPAALAYSGAGRSAGLFHNEHFQGLAQEFLGYSGPAGEGTLGLGLNYFRVGKDLERRSGLNESDPLNPITVPEGRFGAYDLAFYAGYGAFAGRGAALGVSLKMIRQSIDDEAGETAALDLGALRSFRWRGGEYTAGLAVQNLGPGVRFVRRSHPLPLTARATLGRTLGPRGAALALQLEKPVDNYPSLAAGGEYPLTGRMSLRAGYRYRQHGNELGAWSGFSAGAGVAFDRLTFDYAFTPFGVLGESHRFSLALRFGEAGGRAAPPPAARAPAPAPEAGFTVRRLPVSARPITLSPRGARYELKAASEAGALASLSFRALLRGEAPAEIFVSEGAPSGELLAGFPEGVLPLKVLRAGQPAGSVHGDVRLLFRLPRQVAGAGRPVLFYRAGPEWREAALAPAGEEGDSLLFSASAPFSADYALGLKTGE